MIKFLISLVFVGILNAGLVDAIAIIVNDKIITLYDIDELTKQNMSKKDAIGILIDKTLFEIETQKRGIDVDIFEIDNYLAKIAQNNKMSLSSFKSIAKQQYGINYDKYIDNIKMEIKKQKLSSQLVKGKVTIANDEDIKLFYNNNATQFQLAKKIEVIQYLSKNKANLVAISKNPMLHFNNVQVTNSVINIDKVSSSIRYVLNSTKTAKFTPILNGNNVYVMFYIKQKKEIEMIKFAQVRNQIFNQIMKQREQLFLKDYFEKLRLNSKIEFKR